MIRLEDLNIGDKRVFIRADLNVPIKEGRISNDARIKASLKTIEKVVEENCAVTVMSHLGRPKEGEFDKALSLAPVAARLGELLDRSVQLLPEIEDSRSIDNGKIGLLENVRFLKGETKNSDELGKRMAAHCDVFVMDAFGSAHRAHASTNSIANHVDQVCAGYLMDSELSALNSALEAPEKPVFAILGGAKVSSKLMLLERLSEFAENIFVGGGILNTFIAASEFEIGRSLYEENMLETAKNIMAKTTIPIPQDVIVSKAFDEKATGIVRAVEDIREDEMVMDIGPETARTWASRLHEAGTIIWNGPLGVFEFDQFGEGTREIAEGIAKSDAFSLAGGGDTIAAIDKYEVSEGISYISTGGGAFMEFVEGKKLPGVEILKEHRT